MNERRRPHRRGRNIRPRGNPANETYNEADPYRDPSEPSAPPDEGTPPATFAGPPPADGPSGESGGDSGGDSAAPPQAPRLDNSPSPNNQNYNGNNSNNGPRHHQYDNNQQGGSRRGRRNRRGRQRSGQGGGSTGEHQAMSGPPPVIVPDGTTDGWFDASRDAGFIRRAVNSYLADSGDAYVGSHLIRQFGIRRAAAQDLPDALVLIVFQAELAIRLRQVGSQSGLPDGVEGRRRIDLDSRRGVTDVDGHRVAPLVASSCRTRPASTAPT